jgi:hypothetical protein
MAHVVSEWSHSMAYDDPRHTGVAKRGGSCNTPGVTGTKTWA